MWLAHLGVRNVIVFVLLLLVMLCGVVLRMRRLMPFKIQLLLSFVCALALASCSICIERTVRLALAAPPAFDMRLTALPNYHHVWFAHDPVFFDNQGGDLNLFGNDVWRKRLYWKDICPLDSDSDGLTNGEELGDPCCLWTPTAGTSFILQQQREYRRWRLSHPGQPDSEGKRLLSKPSMCSSYNATEYAEQFAIFYFGNADKTLEPVPLVPVKVVGLIALVVVLVYWVAWGDLLQGLIPFAFARPPFSSFTSGIICLTSFLYMDMASGIIHLVLDYAPHWLPVIGEFARGFQFHHAEPTAIVRISWYAYVSHIHVLCPLVAALAVLSDASHAQRLFWCWGAAFAHLFQSAHRWAHMQPEALPFFLRRLQDSGLLLSHDCHMRHHEDLMHQFTILSGHTDIVLDSIAHVVPPTRYDVWLAIGVCWFVLPVLVDLCCRAWIDHHCVLFKKHN